MPLLHAIVYGRVQGVNFRMTSAEHARRLGLKGWVRNLPDRTVETLAVGPQAALDQYLIWLHKGPPGARVDRVEVRRLETSSPEKFDSFEVTY